MRARVWRLAFPSSVQKTLMVAALSAGQTFRDTKGVCLSLSLCRLPPCFSCLTTARHMWFSLSSALSLSLCRAAHVEIAALSVSPSTNSALVNVDGDLAG